MHKPSGLRTVFFGTPEFAAHILEELIRNGEEIVGVVTTPAKPKGRGLKLITSAVHDVADRHNLRVLAPLKLKDEAFQKELRALNADVFCIVAYKILPQAVFTIPSKGSFNIHASLLPKFRGAAPINWAIIRGETKTGITTFLLDVKVDTGKIYLKEEIGIDNNETAGELHDKLMPLGAKLALNTLSGIGDRSLVPIEQSNAEATTAPKIFAKDCVINFDEPAEAVHNFIRGLSSHPGATTVIRESQFKLLRSKLTEKYLLTLAPGLFKVTEDNKRLFCGTATDPIEILELQREGKNAMGTELFLRGSRHTFD
jgi:methionyl-tRNA formyltransferase